MTAPTTAVDLRSDTRTQPDDEVRRAMATATVGDDAYGDDPTVAALEARAATLTGTASALFACSGTMSNLLAVLARTSLARPLVLVAGAQTHLLHHENDGVRRLAGAEVRPVPDGPDGMPDRDTVAVELASVPPGARSLVWLENPHNRHGGAPQTRRAAERVIDLAREYGAQVHLDGARLPNAAVELGVSVGELTAGVDSVSLSLSKGLGAPIGSMLCGSSALIDDARYFRTMIGGTLHQTGVLAAAGLVALGRVPQLRDDHVRTADLAKRLAGVPGLSLHPRRPTNMLVLDVAGARADVVVASLQEHGVRALALDGRRVRVVVHREHTDADIVVAAERIAATVEELR